MATKNDLRPTTAEEIQEALQTERAGGWFDRPDVIDEKAVEFATGEVVIITGARGGNAHINGQIGVIESARRRPEMHPDAVATIKARSGHEPLTEYYRVIPVGRTHMMAIEVPLDGVKEI